MPIEHDERLTADEVHGLLGAWGLSPTPDSPLARLPAPTRVVGEKALRARGLLDPSWQQALGVLAQPTRCFRTIVPLPDRILVQVYYAAAADGSGGMIGCWAEPPHVRVRFPCAPGDFLRESSAMLMADFTEITDPLRVELTPAGLAALAAAVDALRRKLFEGLLARRSPMTLGLADGQLEQAYADGLAGSDMRWLVTLLRLIMPASAPLPSAIGAAGVEELVRAGLLKRNGNQWQAEGPLCRLAAWWKTPLPAVAHELVVLDGGRLSRYGYFIALRGDGPLWLLEFWRGEDDQARVTLRSRTGSGFRRKLRQLLVMPAESPAGATAPSGAAFCTQCGRPREASDMFCGNCGASYQGGGRP